MKSQWSIGIAGLFFFSIQLAAGNDAPNMQINAGAGGENPLRKSKSDKVESKSKASPFADAQLLSEKERAGANPKEVLKTKLVKTGNFKFKNIRIQEKIVDGKTVSTEEMVADQMLVKMKPGANRRSFENFCKSKSFEIVKEVKGSPGLFIVKIVPPGTDPLRKDSSLDSDSLPDAISAMEDESAIIEYAQPDHIVHALDTTPNDPKYTDNTLWGINKIGCPAAWDKTTGSNSIVIGVIDTGVEYTHEDLAANIWTNPGEIAGNGIDDDSNGYIDDVHGWDFCNDDSDPMDDQGHGTHCSGTIGGVGNNGIAVAGVNWNVKIMALKFLSASGSGATSDGIACINYATLMGADITSNSWGGSGYDQAVKDAIDANGKIFAAAAGNSAFNNDMSSSRNYPSSYSSDNIIAVAATDNADILAGFSCYGATTVDLAAPGVSIYSTDIGNTYSNKDGTSMATPHVAGATAIVLAANPGLSVSDLKSLIVFSGDPCPSLVGKCLSGARLNVNRAISPYNVVYDGNGNTGGTAPTDHVYPEDATVTLLPNSGNLVRAGYSFIGWNTAADGSGTSYAVGGTFTMPANDVTIYAKWTDQPTYNVTYDGNGNTGGTVPSDVNNYLGGSTVTVLPNSGLLVKTGYTFARWNTQADGLGTDYRGGETFTISTPVTLYARWKSPYSGGLGSMSSPYQIANTDDLQDMSTVTTDWNKYFIQTADIDATETSTWNGGTGWIPVSNESNPFTGYYDGQNHTINKLYTYRLSSDSIGFFGYISGATVKNLGVTNVNFTGYDWMGGVVGFAENESNISNCYASGTVNGDFCVGGLAGVLMDNSTINNCHASGTAISANGRVGGLLGLSWNYCSITNSYASTNVNSSGAPMTDLGGLVGLNNEFSTVDNCYATGTIGTGGTIYGPSSVGGLVGTNTASSIISNSYATGNTIGADVVGGFAGSNQDGSTIRNCYARGNQTTLANSLLWGTAGFCGKSANDSTTEYCFSTGRPSGTYWNSSDKGFVGFELYDNNYTANFFDKDTSTQTSSRGATAKGTAEMKLQSTFAGWDFFNIWRIAPSINDGYPHLFTSVVTYDGNGSTGGTPPVDSSTYVTGETVTLLANSGSLVKTGYTFVGWNTAASGLGLDYRPGDTFTMPEGNVTIYAKWTNLGTYTVNYSGNGNTGGSAPWDSNNYISGSTATVLGNPGNLTKTGFRFGGWNTASDGSGTNYRPTADFTISSNTTLYAKWKTPYSGGAGTVGDPYIIANLSDLEELSMYSSDWSLQFIQTADIDGASIFTWNDGEGFSPIGNESVKFTGSYDGQNYAIDNLFISRLGVGYQGLFGYAIGATIKNIGLTNLTVTGKYGVGGLAGAIDSTAVTNCFVTGNVTGYNSNVGGLVGHASNHSSFNDCFATGNVSGCVQTGGLIGYMGTTSSTITNCFASGTVSGDEKVGGLIGAFQGYGVGTGATITNCYASAAVNADHQLGGLVGWAGWGATISKCYATGTVNSTNSAAGGFVGFSDGDTVIENCYSRGDVVRTSNLSEQLGGFAGVIEWRTTIRKCYSTGKVYATNGAFPAENGFIADQLTLDNTYIDNYYDKDSSEQPVGNGATAKSTAEMKTLTTFGGWDFTTIWRLNAGTNDGYPAFTGSTSFTVIYDGNGNTNGAPPPDSNSYAKDATVTVCGNTGYLVKTGYSFGGWNTVVDGSGTTYTPGETFSMPDESVTLYAKWIVIPTYTVTYNGNGYTGGIAPTDSTRYAAGASVAVLGNSGNLTKTGFHFNYWNTAADGSGTNYFIGSTFSMPAGNLTLYAKWSASPTYTVTYNGNGNTANTAPTDSNNYTSGATVTVFGNIYNLVKTGYTFACWNSAANGSGTDYNPGATFAMPGGNLTLYAKWTNQPTYTVTYDGNGNTGGSAPIDTKHYLASETITVLGNSGSLTRNGFVLSGWNTRADGAGTDYAPGATLAMPEYHLTLYAKWSNIAYTVTYDGNTSTGGSAPSDPNNYVYGEFVTVRANTGSLVKTGNTFVCWNTASNGSGTDYNPGATFAMPAASVTLYAKWTSLSTYPVTYNGNGSSGGTVPVPQTKIQDTALTLAGNSGYLVKTGFAFAGWNTAADGAGTDYAAGASYTANAAVTLYAKWTVATFTLTYTPAANGSISGTSPQTVNYGTSGTAVTAVPDSGYYFVKWSDDSLNNPRTDAGVTADIAVAANFALDEASLIVMNNNDSGAGSLRDVIANAADDSKIRFNGSFTITLASSLSIGKNLIIDAESNSVIIQANAVRNTATYRVIDHTSGTLTLKNLTVRHGVCTDASNSGGGGIRTAGMLVIDSCSILDNDYNTSGTGGGGGISVQSHATGLVMSNSTISGNKSAFLGGGIRFLGNMFTITNCTIANNTSTYTGKSGGAIFVYGGYAPDGDMNIYNTTITGNTAPSYGPGGIYITAGTIYLYSSILAGNSAAVAQAAYDDFDLYAGTVIDSKCLVGKQGSASVFTAGLPNANGSYIGTSAAPVPSGLLALADNGGNTKTCAVQGTSTALNNGSNPQGLGTDQRGTGYPRSYGAGVDIGAYERQAAYTVTYNGNGNTGGTAPTDSNEYDAGATVTVLANSDLVKTGYTFIGWNSTTDGSGTDYSPGTTFTMPAGNLTLYAKWTDEPVYTVTYDGNGNTGGSAPTDSNTYMSGSTVTILGNSGSLIKTGYTFTCWNSATDGSGTDYNPSATFAMPAGNLTLYAKWTIRTYTLTYTAGANGSISGSSPQTVNHGGSGTAVTPVPNANYHFVNWSDASTANPRTDTNVTANVSVTANFAADALVVMNNNDSGAGSLRQIVADAPADSTITFNASFTITLASSISIGKNLTIDGGANTIIVQANAVRNTATYRVLDHTTGTLTLRNITVRHGKVSTANGAGIRTTGTLVIDSCSIVDNDCTFSGSPGGGGGIAVDTGATSLTISNSTISGNVAAWQGGGIRFNTGALTMKNCTLANNTASRPAKCGGGLYFSGSVASNIYNSTITGNSTPATGTENGAGGGVYMVAGTLNLYSTILAGNSAVNQPANDDFIWYTGTVTNSNCLIGKQGDASIFTAGSPNANGSYVGTGASPVSAGIASLANNGGKTLTCAVQAGSIALDHGSNPQSLTTDQRGVGYPRSAGSAVDIGAYEFQIPITHTVTFSAGAGGTLTGVTSQTVDDGEDCSAVTAVHSSGFRFINWTGDYSGMENPLTVTNVTEDMDITANFARVSPEDFNGDMKSDVICESPVENGFIYFMNGVTPSAPASVYDKNDKNWTVAKFADFNGDGKCDMLWKHEVTGQTLVYIMNGASIVTARSIYKGGDWKVEDCADFNGDGKDDVLWIHPQSGFSAIYLMNGVNVSSVSTLHCGIGWLVRKVADFNGDAKADILWEINGVQGLLCLMNGATVSSEAMIYSKSPAWNLKLFGDFNGDSKTDILWESADGKTGYVYLMNGTAVLPASGYSYIKSDLGWKIVNGADYNGDGKSDILWEHDSDAHGMIHLMDGTAILDSKIVYTLKDPNPATKWNVVKTLDFNGDGKSDMLWENAATKKTLVYVMDGFAISSSGTVYSNGTGWNLLR